VDRPRLASRAGVVKSVAGGSIFWRCKATEFLRPDRSLRAVMATADMAELLRQVGFAFDAPPSSDFSAKLYHLVRELLLGVAVGT
jgi:hypothetical protein